MKKAIIIFQKNLELGKVKTRLAATVGDENALKIYTILVNHTHAEIQKTEADKFLFFSNYLDEDVKWSHCNLHEQEGNDLGLRMFNAINKVKAMGVESIVVIGTDCYEFTSKHLNDAFLALESNDYCIGPAIDGGYYLIGTNRADEEVFLNKEWSTATVFEEAKANIKAIGKSVGILEILPDVDYEEDLKTLRQYLD
ncbi:MAG: TIGR04282 family arsenosugar biosynthesis glycosyltransferase [Flavobacteriales bacterium]|jgi:uncharacterized protein